MSTAAAPPKATMATAGFDSAAPMMPPPNLPAFSAAAKAADNAFVTVYASTEDQEDLAESGLFGLAMWRNPDRLPQEDRDYLTAQIPNRLAFWSAVWETGQPPVIAGPVEHKGSVKVVTGGFVKISVPGNGAFKMSFLPTSGPLVNAPSGTISGRADIAVVPALEAINEGARSNITFASTPLNGTTGGTATARKWTMSCPGDGTLLVQNRTPNARVLRYEFTCCG